MKFIADLPVEFMTLFLILGGFDVIDFGIDGGTVEASHALKA